MGRTAPIVVLALLTATVPASPSPGSPEACLRVTVLGPDGRPVRLGEARLYATPLPAPEVPPGFPDRFAPDEAAPEPVRRTAIVCGAAGFAGLRAGRSRVVGTAPGCARAEATVDRVPGLPPADVRFRLAPAARLAGRVTFGGEAPLAGVEVDLAPLGSSVHPPPPDRAFRTRTDAGGRYRLEGMGSGLHRLSTRRPGRGWVEGPVVALPGVERLDVGLVDGEVVAGRVTDAATGEPVAGASLAVLGGWWPDYEVRGEAVAGPDGRFTIGGLGAGEYVLGIDRPGREVPGRRVVVPAEGDVELVLPAAEK